MVTGEVSLCMCSSVPIEGISFLLGNGLAEGKVLVTPEISLVPIKQSSVENPQNCPGVLASCAISRSKSKMMDVDLDFLDKSEGKFSHVPREASNTCDVFSDFEPAFLCRGQLIAEHIKDVTFLPLFDSVITNEKLRFLSTGYFLQDGLLIHKRTTIT